MALQVWLPFTDGTLKQQGLNSASATVGGTVNLTNAGKLGKCATIGTAAGGITLPASTMTSFTECSVAFWIKVISWNTSYATFFQAGLGSTPWNNYIFGILRNNQGSNLCFTLTNSSGSSTSASYTSSNLEVGQWYHLAFTYKAGTVCIYKDGVLDKTYNTTYVPNFAGITHISIGRSTNNSGYQTNCNLNDFRIYDHCLSPMEVKELAKGLVLHYPLNRGGWGQENLFIDSTYEQADSSIANSSTDWSKYFRRYNGSAGIHSFSDYTDTITLSTTGNLGVTFQRKATDINLDSTSYYTLSCEAKSTQTARPLCIGLSYYNNSNSWVWRGGSNPTYFKEVNKWQKFTLTFKPDADTQYIDYCFTVTGVSSGTDTFSIRHCKLEKGSVATPWCPNSSDNLADEMGLNGTTEYDCSGYCNNGTRTGTFSWTSDTPKYQVSTKIAAASTGIKTSNFYVGDIWSMSMWFKYPSQDSSGWKALVILNNNGGDADLQFGNYINCSSNTIQYSANGKYTTGVTFTYGKWHHIVNTYDGTTLKCYLDGVYKTSVTPGQTLSRSNLGIGFKSSAVDFSSVSSSFTNGFLSDVRVYATALSASDVKSLYQNSAYIDSSGNVYGAVHSEV